MHKWWGNGITGVLTQTIWSTLTLATQINTLSIQTLDGTNNTNSNQAARTLRQNKIIDITHTTNIARIANAV